MKNLKLRSDSRVPGLRRGGPLPTIGGPVSRRGPVRDA